MYSIDKSIATNLQENKNTAQVLFKKEKKKVFLTWILFFHENVSHGSTERVIL